MAWIDDRLWCHPKIAGVPKAARWTYAASIAYSSGFSTGGVLDRGQLQMIGAEQKERMALITVGLWDELGDGAVRIHDWDEHNGKRDARKAADRARKRAAYNAGKPAESPQENVRRNGGEPAENREEARALTVVKEVTGEEVPKDTLVELSSSTVHVQRIYDHWRAKRGKSRSNYDRLSEGRRAKIKARLREFTVEELCQAIDGVSLDPWPERALHDDLTVIFRSREQVDKFLELAATGGDVVAAHEYDEFRAFMEQKTQEMEHGWADSQPA